ncbi:sensor histidine kinase [Marinifilum sp. D737]|uniref:sensor histidine kinase n=1 Tax=Marinifilum sp. D737 TaxID=2969628 RepID=UPI0022756824|nr:HAMP domain-containing sensor histidine kinase [Marinifilum sp. D737]MCY1633925.1 HAMP domain-containing histidine kinase [Marinifilum sp. D737]
MKKQKENELLIHTRDSLVLLNAMAHDLKQPLTTIIGFVDLCICNMDQIGEDNLKKYLNMVLKLAQKADQQIALIAQNNFDLSSLVLVLEKFDLVAFLEEMTNCQRAYFDDKNLHFKLLIDEFPREVTSCLPALEIILRNLISNAVKFTPMDGEISMEVTRSDKLIRISIQDSGVGMDAGQLQQLYEKGRSKPGTCGEVGFGIGLPLCKQIADRVGIQLTFQSQIGMGTLVHLEFESIT